MKYIIYKIVNKFNKNDCYIGSTKNLKRRILEHKGECKTPKFKIHMFITENGGFNNFYFYIIDIIECEEGKQLITEDKYITELKPPLNMNKAYIENKEEYYKEYQERNKEKLNEYHKKYVEQNKEQLKEYRERNKEQIKDYKKQYIDKNKEKIKDYQKQYIDKNKELIKKKMKEYREHNKEQIKEQRKIYYEANKQKYKDYYEVNKTQKK